MKMKIHSRHFTQGCVSALHWGVSALHWGSGYYQAEAGAQNGNVMPCGKCDPEHSGDVIGAKGEQEEEWDRWCRSRDLGGFDTSGTARTARRGRAERPGHRGIFSAASRLVGFKRAGFN